MVCRKLSVSKIWSLLKLYIYIYYYQNLEQNALWNYYTKGVTLASRFLFIWVLVPEFSKNQSNTERTGKSFPKAEMLSYQ